MGAEQSNPNINKGFRKRFCSLELSIVNKTERATLQLKEEHFSSGSWFEHFLQASMEPGKTYTAFVSSKKGAPFGVTGGLKFAINNGKKQKYLILGFTNPMLGSYGTYINISVDDDCTARSGHENSKNNSHKFLTVEGYQLEAVVQQAQEGGDKMIIFTISDS